MHPHESTTQQQYNQLAHIYDWRWGRYIWPQSALGGLNTMEAGLIQVWFCKPCISANALTSLTLDTDPSKLHGVGTSMAIRAFLMTKTAIGCYRIG